MLSLLLILTALVIINLRKRFLVTVSDGLYVALGHQNIVSTYTVWYVHELAFYFHTHYSIT